MFISPLFNFAQNLISVHVVASLDALTVQLTPIEHITYVAEVFDMNSFALLGIVDIEVLFAHLNHSIVSV